MAGIGGKIDTGTEWQGNQDLPQLLGQSELVSL